MLENTIDESEIFTFQTTFKLWNMIALRWYLWEWAWLTWHLLYFYLRRKSGILMFVKLILLPSQKNKMDNTKFVDAEKKKLENVNTRLINPRVLSNLPDRKREFFSIRVVKYQLRNYFYLIDTADISSTQHIVSRIGCII